ncbi:MAG: hypothetical protein OH319_03930 [Candidatus Parvarchaeota archaeon]|nr:hypothetical protein [Candidatus Jingweiarchaeum tengchongense]MCW1298065.1 hypothetical protein [Candidatus Jingweiarchaeum tengchongense]MCW1300135.1 hypothetical protein [Candidatus Jingweiarchaeum tengchongense]MCW1309684.1 hypothetical protein [Candidatus Jingweiarchaeum tengchongense]MCW1310897.1 hypothetical protein [Candidatus Jingweiarchaeum tengchongense]
MDKTLDELVEEEVQRVINFGGLGNVVSALGKFVKDEQDYARLIRNGLETHLNGAKNLKNIRTKEEAVHASIFLTKYLHRLVEVMSDLMGHPEYIQTGIKVADEVLEDFMKKFEKESNYRSYGFSKSISTLYKTETKPQIGLEKVLYH